MPLHQIAPPVGPLFILEKWSTRHQIYTVANSDRGRASDRKLIPIKNTTVLDQKFITLSQRLKNVLVQLATLVNGTSVMTLLEYGFDFNIAGGKHGAPGSYYLPFGNKKNQIK